jgi:hypothetical protein
MNTDRTWSATLTIAGEKLDVTFEECADGRWYGPCPDLKEETVKEALAQAREWWPLAPFDITIDLFKTTKAHGTKWDGTWYIDVSNKCHGNGLKLVARR